MKKVTLLLVGLMASGMASAVQLAASGAVRIADCALLNEDVAINVSTGVAAGVSCNARAIAVTACHTAGRTTQRSVPVCIDADNNVDTGVGGLEDCTTTAPAVTTGPAYASATTLAGTVTSQYPGGAACTAALAEARATANLPAVQ
ncbi:hypothetical protein LJY18_01755 [Pseudomonas sp. MMS21-TM103]|uniref:hypothetical protein n=1 Tax=Pseudomonas sp. MMS21 TM103 TaxID=2886506 RepID=UPI001EE13454|nr:hypothetical protein [Pseudomonas sp. MMS21 TM103]MCG4452030.1 hypothetical protein [Pseudomonas sp. MMS21 TM103]